MAQLLPLSVETAQASPQSGQLRDIRAADEEDEEPEEPQAWECANEPELGIEGYSPPPHIA